MSQLLRLAAAAALCVLLADVSAAQTQICPTDQATCRVNSGQFLNRVINGDTTTTGTRSRTDRIYELARDGQYLMDTDVRNDGYHLRIYGAEGATGQVARVYTILNSESGNAVGDPFGMQGDLTLRNFAMQGVPPADLFPDQAALENMSTRVIRVRSAGFDLVMDRFVAVNFVANIVRAQAALRKFIMTDSKWINSGWLGDNGTNFGAGSGIDLRDGSIDSLIIRNSTFANYTDRIIRHRNSTAPIAAMIFDHNTIVNAVSYHGTFALGEVGSSVQITNNLFYDSFVAGADSSDIVRQEEFNESGELYSNGLPAMQWIFSVPNQTTEWTVDNNAYVVSQPVRDFYATYGDGQGDDGNPDNGVPDNDIIGAGAPLTDHILSRIDNDDMAFTEFSFGLADVPDPMIDMVTWYRTPQSQGGAGRTKETINFNVEEDDYDRRDLTYFLNTFDASYGTDEAAYSAGQGGCPVGDLNWFPDRKTDCSRRNVSNEDPIAGNALRLSAGPNPFGAATTLRFELPTAQDVSLKVYDTLGREVATLSQGLQAAGAGSVRWDASGIAPGLYVVRMQAGDTVVTQRVTIVR